MNKSDKPQLIEKIDKDEYKFEVHDGYAFNTEGGIILADKKSSTFKITPNEIILYGSMKKIVSKLAHTSINRIEFKNQFLAEETVSLYLKKDFANDKWKPGISQHLALENLLKAYNSKIEDEQRNTIIWELSIEDSDLFEKYFSAETVKQKLVSIRSFYGKTDTIMLNHTDAKQFAKTLQINYDVEVRNKIDQFVLFSVKLPNTSYGNLNKFMRANYGIEINERRDKAKFLIIKNSS